MWVDCALASTLQTLYTARSLLASIVQLLRALSRDWLAQAGVYVRRCGAADSILCCSCAGGWGRWCFVAWVWLEGLWCWGGAGWESLCNAISDIAGLR